MAGCIASGLNTSAALEPFKAWDINICCPATACSTDEDCGTALCSKTLAGSEGAAVSSGPGYCVSDYYFGWDDCAAMGARGKVRVVGSCIVSVGMMVAFVYGVLTLVPWMKKKGCQRDTQTVVLVLCCSGALGGIAMQIAVILRTCAEITQPTYNTLLTMFVSVYGFSISGALYTLILSWLSIASASKRLQSAKKAIRRSQNAVVGFIIFYACIGLPLLALNRVDLFTILIAAGNLIFIIVTVLGERKLKELMHKSEALATSFTVTVVSTSDATAEGSGDAAAAQKKKPQSPLRRIITTAWRLVAVNAVILTFSLLFTVTKRSAKLRMLNTVISAYGLFTAPPLAVVIMIRFLNEANRARVAPSR